MTILNKTSVSFFEEKYVPFVLYNSNLYNKVKL